VELLRFFAGLTAEETAEVLGISVLTVHREWNWRGPGFFVSCAGHEGVPVEACMPAAAEQRCAIYDSAQARKLGSFLRERDSRS